MNMGARIKELLEARGWKQIDLLERVPELDARSLSALISRDSRFSECAFGIAKAFGVSLDYLIFGIEDEAANNGSVNAHDLTASDVCELLTTYAALDEAGRSFVLEAARARLQHSPAANKRQRRN